MIRKLFVCILCISILNLNADTPGKQSMNSSKVVIENINRLTDYDFYWQPEYDSAKLVNSDTTFVIPSSGGAPYNATFWGVNKATKHSTDTLSFENYYAPDLLITVDSINNNKFHYSKKEISNSNAGGVLGDNNSTKPGDRPTKLILYSSISLIALILLVWYFMRRKTKTDED